MKPIQRALAAAVMLGCLLILNGPRAAVAAPPETLEYAIIQWDGEHKTQVIWPDGHVEFLASLLPGTSPPGDGVHMRAFIMTMLINKLAKQGYEYAGMASGEEIVMKKIR